MGCEPSPRRGYQTRFHPQVPLQSPLGSTGRALQEPLRTASPLHPSFHPTVEHLLISPRIPGAHSKTEHAYAPSFGICFAAHEQASSASHITPAPAVVWPPLQRAVVVAASACQLARTGPAKTEKGGFSRQSYSLDPARPRCCKPQDHRLDWLAALATDASIFVVAGPVGVISGPQSPVSRLRYQTADKPVAIRPHSHTSNHCYSGLL